MSNDQDDDGAERELRDRLRRGDHDDFVEAHRGHVGAVYAAAHRLTGSTATAEDVTSETFLAAWRNRASLTVDDRPLRSWLLAIATRQSLNAKRGVVDAVGERPGSES